MPKGTIGADLQDRAGVGKRLPEVCVGRDSKFKRTALTKGAAKRTKGRSQGMAEKFNA
jgi:hypothetical protein